LLIGCKDKNADSQLPVNVIYILVDDLGYRDLGCYGQKIIRTPHIDRMASEGMLFTQHYAGCTVSAPSRASLMTGLHTRHTQIRGNKEVKPEGQEPIHGDIYTLARLFKSKDYETGIFGKWGLGFPGSASEPNVMGFNEFYGYNCQRQAHTYYPEHLWNNEVKVEFPGNKKNRRKTYQQEHNCLYWKFHEQKDRHAIRKGDWKLSAKAYPEKNQFVLKAKIYFYALKYDWNELEVIKNYEFA
jgi:arylsulfatase A-like enzyme